MVKTIEGQLIAKGKKFAIVISRFNDFISKRLLEGAVDTLTRHGAKEAEIEAVWVPGSFEIPVVANRLAKSKKFDAVLCLGAIIRVQPPFRVCIQRSRKRRRQGIYRYSVPVIFGVITADNLEQAIERAGTKDGNKGRDAAVSAIEMANLLENI
jgi:6,7-dimethyl-8-ribityllumazine synthase